MKWAWERRHLIMAMVWVVLLVPSLLFWKESVLWVICLSIYANFASSLSTYASQKQAREQKERDDDS